MPESVLFPTPAPAFSDMVREGDFTASYPIGGPNDLFINMFAYAMPVDLTMNSSAVSLVFAECPSLLYLLDPEGKYYCANS